jgi:agmatine deiminase
MPAEWEPHRATWIAWPHNRKDWPGKFAAIPHVYAEIVRHLVRFEPVEILVQDERALAAAHRVLGSGPMRFHICPTDRAWVRDSGCTFVKSGEDVQAMVWRFNAWAKYDDWARDGKVGAFMAQAAGVPAQSPAPPIVLEGGSIDVNGYGTLLTTEECLLSPIQARNPGLGRAGYGRIFSEHLGIRQVIWLGRGLTGDDTHGHVDDLARFVSPDTIVAATAPRGDPDFEPLRMNLERLRAARDPEGRPWRVLELPSPGPIHFRGVRLPASYANFYVANGLVLVPVFNDVEDRHALSILAECFPEREVVGIYCGDLVWGFGALHCMTQQQPG